MTQIKAEPTGFDPDQSAVTENAGRQPRNPDLGTGIDLILTGNAAGLSLKNAYTR